MNLRAHTILGLAVEQRSAVAAEIHTSGDEVEVARTAEFAFPQDCSFEEPETLGEALGEFLATEDFSARQVVLGVPAKWLVAREKQVPAGSPQSTAQILRLQAERDFSTSPDQLVMDYVPSGEAAGKRTVLLVAVQRSKMESAVTMARTAGLKVKAVTSSGMVLAASGGETDSGTSCTLYVRPDGTDFVLREGQQFRMVKHLSFAGSAASDPEARAKQLVGQLRRTLAVLPKKQITAPPESLRLWNSADIDGKSFESATEELSLRINSESTVRAGEEETISLNDPRFAAAVALALTGVHKSLRPIDFTNSRFATRERKLPGKRVVYAAVAGLAIIVIAAFMGLQWHSDKEQVADLQARLEQMKPEVKEARNLIEKVSDAQEWFRKKPRYLDCLREVTMSFPERGDVWATSVAMQRDMRCVLTGKAVDKQSVIQVRQDMEKSTNFSSLELLYLRQSEAASGEVSFAVSFDFLETE